MELQCTPYKCRRQQRQYILFGANSTDRLLNEVCPLLYYNDSVQLLTCTSIDPEMYSVRHRSADDWVTWGLFSDIICRRIFEQSDKIWRQHKSGGDGQLEARFFINKVWLTNKVIVMRYNLCRVQNQWTNPINSCFNSPSRPIAALYPCL